MSEIAVLGAHNGGTVNASVGDVIAVHLAENATTGYRWRIDAAGSLRVIDGEAKPGTGLGGGGERIFRFAAVAPGSTSIQLSLCRQWETAAQTRFALTVEIA